MMWGGYGGMGWSWIIGLVVMTVVVAVAVGVIVRLVPDGRNTRNASEPTVTSARHILDERYARGELTTAEYQERVAVLHQTQ